MFVYKHTKAVEYVKKWPTLKKKQKTHKIYGWISLRTGLRTG